MYEARRHLFYTRGVIFLYTENFLVIAIALYQFDTVQIEYTTVIPSDDLRLFKSSSCFI
jgi:hypothetical protein